MFGTVMSVAGLLFYVVTISNDKESKQQTPSTNITSEVTEIDEFVVSRDDIVGQWRSVVTNPAHPNTIANRYMRHSFFNDGTVVIENKEDTVNRGKWEFKDGFFIVTSSYGTSKFFRLYELASLDELLNTRFQSIIDGKPLADYNPKERYIRQGSNAEKKMKIMNIFENVKSAMNFIDPSSLQINSTYYLSKRTPLMPAPPPSSAAQIIALIDKVLYLNSGDKISILDKKTIGNAVWYQVKSGEKNGWINSIALFGQKLEQ